MGSQAARWTPTELPTLSSRSMLAKLEAFPGLLLMSDLRLPFASVRAEDVLSSDRLSAQRAQHGSFAATGGSSSGRPARQRHNSIFLVLPLTATETAKDLADCFIAFAISPDTLRVAGWTLDGRRRVLVVHPRRARPISQSDDHDLSRPVKSCPSLGLRFHAQAAGDQRGTVALGCSRG